MADIQAGGGQAAPGLRPRWTRLATLGFGSAATGLAVLIVAVLSFGLSTDDIGFFVVIFAVVTVLTLVVWRFGTWSKIVGIVLGLLGSLMLFWMVFGIFQPTSFFDFFPSVLFLPGMITGFVSCIAALVAKRRGNYTAKAEGGEQRGIRIALTIAGVAALLSGILTLASRTTADASRAAAIATQKSFDYHPTSITIAGGEKLFVQNKDPVLHTFTVDALGIDESFTVGTSKLIGVPAKPGTYVFYCRPHTENKEHPTKDDMAGTLTIT